MTDVRTRLPSRSKRLEFGMLRAWFRAGARFRRRRVVVYWRHPAFERKAAVLQDRLRSHGFRVRVRSGMSLATWAYLSVSDDLWVGYWYLVPPELFPASYVFVNTEPLAVREARGDAEWFDAMRGARAIWGYQRIRRGHRRSPGCALPIRPVRVRAVPRAGVPQERR